MINVDLSVPIHDDISKNIGERLHNYVNLTKEFLKNGYTSHGRAFHSTFALDHNRFLAVGFNDYRRNIDYIRGLGKIKKYDDPISTYRMALHSEIDCILKLGKINFSSISFVNVHIDKNFHCRGSKPCPNCLNTLMQIGAKRIYFYDENMKKFRYIKL